MTKNEKPAAAEVDVRFRLPDGRIVELPAARWLLANRSRLTRRMGLSAFLRKLPMWLIRDVEQSARATGSAAGPDADVPSSATILTLEHLRMWSPTPIDAMADIPENFEECVAMFEAACGLETLRRHGVLKVHVSGEDRLGRDEHMQVELNPVVMAELMKRGPVASDRADFFDQFARLTDIAASTDWADRAALRDET